MRTHVVFALTAIATGVSVGAIPSLQVDTTSGRAYGMINGSNPDVVQFLGIPYGEAPVGSLRFSPPKMKLPVGDIDATKSGPNCPQYYSNNATLYPSVYAYDSPFLQPLPGWSEDCLNLNIWTPYSTQHNSSELLPVIIWIFGGGFYEGGTNTLGFDASYWVQRSKSHIGVAMNARVNIFGFPNARGLHEIDENVNVGLMDQRLAIEWIRDNIEAFGGDPSQMVVWGQSSGSASTDYLNYAYPDDPIVGGFIQHSGSVFATGQSKDSEMLNFTAMAQNVGCADLSAAEELSCMRHNASAEDIIDYYQKYNLNPSQGALSFTTIVDEITKFSNYTQRALAGNFSQLPVISGTNGHEMASLASWPGPSGPNMTDLASTTLSHQQCPENYNAGLRAQLNVTTFRYLNNASFPNISPRWWEGAYHTSELPLLFGNLRFTDLYVAFARDPINALPALGWPSYTPEGQLWLWNPKDDNGVAVAVSKLISAESVISPCDDVAWSISEP
ncbi:Alpha/Beta hydrolase protein [Aspergillus pseudoustus]|uniref:Carboxylic ester hydrolase n=1 Tax=Aspergillus pseudoustus TaxID=1810923 RepID=A0ABR4JUM6_9EURO